MPRTKKVVKAVGGGGSKDDIDEDSKNTPEQLNQLEKPVRKKRAYRRKKKSLTKNQVMPKFRELFVQRLIDKCGQTKKMAISIEKGVYNYVVKKAEVRSIPNDFRHRIFRDMYFNKIRSIYVNVMNNSYVHNDTLETRLKKKEINPDQLAFMKPQEVHPENWRLLVEERERRYKIMFEVREDEITGVFQCGRCKSWKTKHTEAQTRSADEPMTVFVMCYTCGKNWKQ
jgi:transcription elongation factor S-II